MPTLRLLRGAQIAVLVAAAGLLLLTSAPAASAASSPGRFDPRFGDGGIVERNFGTERTSGSALGVVVDAKGRALVLEPGRVGVAVARYLPDGRLDRSFGDGGIALDPRTSVYGEGGLALGPGGTIVVSAEAAITRFTAAGELDRSYGDDGRVGPARGSAAFGFAASLVLADGSVVSARPNYGRGGRAGVVVARFGPRGRVDPTYGGDGRAFAPLPDSYSPVAAIVAQGDGVLIAVPVESVEGDGFALARLDGEGRLDPDFGDGGQIEVDGLRGRPIGITLEAGGAIVVATESNRFVRLTASGQLDSGFGRDGVVGGPAPKMKLHSLVQAADGDLLGIGSVRTSGGPYPTTEFAVERLAADGSAAAGFGIGGYATARPGAKLRNEALAGAVLPEGGLLLAGEAAVPNDETRTWIALAALEADGEPATDFGRKGTAIHRALSPAADAATDLLVDSSGRLVVAGRAQGRAAVLRFSGSGRLDRRFGDAGARLLPAHGRWRLGEGPALAAEPDGGLVVGAGTGGTPGLFRLSAGGEPRGRFGASRIGEVTAVVATEDGGVVAGGEDGIYRGLLAGFDSHGRPDRGFGRDGLLRAGEFGFSPPLARGPGGVLAALAPTGAPRELTASGQPLATTNAGIRWSRRHRRLPRRIADLAFDGRKLVVLGARGQRLAVARLLPNGRPDPRFGDDGRVALRLGAHFVPGALAIEPSGRAVVAGVSFGPKGPIEGAPGRVTVVRLTASGRLDRSFGARGRYVERQANAVVVSAVGLGPDSITVGGSVFDHGSRDLALFLARLGR